ncbi:protein TIC 40, chloroplastic-like isoform X2 [Fagus crenata]
MITTPFLTASTAPLLPCRRVGAGFHTLTLTRTRCVVFGVKCVKAYPGSGPKWRDRRFARISSSSETSSIGVNPQLSVPPPPPSYIGSPLFWIGVGVGLSALFSWVATNLKKYAMQQAFKTLMGQMNSQNNQFNNAAFDSGASFPFPMPSGPVPSTSPAPAASQHAVTVDVPAKNVEAAPAAALKDEKEVKEPKKVAFVDVSPEEAEQKRPYESFEDVTRTSSSTDAQIGGVVSQNGATSKGIGGTEWSQSNAAGFSLSQSTGNSIGSEGSQSTGKSVLSVEALEKMMEDPTVQKMVYPHLPEEMRNPDTFKWMLQNPQYRQQLEDMLNNMGGSNEWDNRVMDSLKNFDLNSPEVKQQFDQIGLSPEEAISRIMANPEVALAFQNPRVQAAIMDCSQNPLSIAKYQNDKEVMDVFNKLSELFPGVTGPP